MSGWIVDARWDLAWIVGPCAGAGLLAMLLPDTLDLGLLGWLGLVAAVDVAHTWASLGRTLLRPRPTTAVERWTWAGCLAGAVAIAGLLQLGAPAQTWRVLAYVAAFHFVRQQGGFTAIYRARAGLPTRDVAGRVERALVQLLCLTPLAWWHASLPRRFWWFVPGDFVPLPVGVAWATTAATAALLAAHLRNRVREGGGVQGRDLWLVATAIAWGGGILASNGDAPFTVSNVVSHGVPYFALVLATNAREQGLPRPSPGPVVALVAGCVALGVGEELLWDAFAWQEHVFTWLESPSEAGLRLATFALLVPQLTHYLLDGVLWRGAGARAAPAVADRPARLDAVG